MEADAEFDAGTLVAMVEKVIISRTDDGKKITLWHELKNGQIQVIKI